MLQTLFPADAGFTVTWGPPESARSLLSTAAIKYKEANPTAPPTNTVGIPGMSVFRTDCPRDDRSHSLPKAYRGWPQGEFNPNQQQVSVNGQVTTGDTIELTLTSLDISGNHTTVSYVIQENDNYVNIATGLANAINANSALTTANITAFNSYNIVNIFNSQTSVNTLTITNTSPSGQTEKVLIQNDLSGLWSFVKFIPVRAEYTLKVVTESLSDMNYIESQLWFMEIYKAVTTVIQGNTINWNFYARNDHTYSRENNEETGRPIWYIMECTYEVDSQWAQGIHVPTINQVLTTYEEMVDGSPVVFNDVVTVFNKNMGSTNP